MAIKENLRGDRPPGIWRPGDPEKTEYEENCWRLANVAAGLPLWQRPDRMYLSATHYGQLLAELRSNRQVPRNRTPGYLIFGKNPEFKILNSGTDDPVEVNRLNHETPGAIDFVDRVRQFTRH